MSQFYLTTPLYYVNSRPHIGHSYTEIAADVLARWHRQQGREVYFLTGTDEHGQKIARAAAEAGLSPQEFTDKISRTFGDLWRTLNISEDDFIRTTEQRHQKAVRHVWEEIRKKKVDGQDVLYRHTYDGFYCVSCETFVAEGALDSSQPAACPDCKKPLERMKEDTYFFRMSVFQTRLMKDIREGRLKILPESRQNEVLGFLEHNTLADLSVSRPKNRLAWGIPVPFDPDHVTYVWFDALINYISAVGYGSDAAKFSKWWPADVHIIGKDILRHHAVIWPALLYALDLPLPKLIFAHGWWVQGGEKMSKSRGNAVDPVEIVKTYGVDAYRFFLLRETPFGQDGTFSEEALVLRYNVDLANNLGNLLSRTLTMCEKYFEGRVPEFPPARTPLIQEVLTLRDFSRGLMKRLEGPLAVLAFSEALGLIGEVVDHANRLIEKSAPWTLAKEKRTDELKAVLSALYEVLEVLAQAVAPFMPQTGQAMAAQLGTGGVIAKGAPLFPRIDPNRKN